MKHLATFRAALKDMATAAWGDIRAPLILDF